MSSHKVVGLLIACGSAMFVACRVRNTVPPDFLPTPQLAGQSVHGGWVDLRVRTGATVDSLRGELLAVSNDSLWIQPPDTQGVVVARRAIESGKITYFRTQGSVTAWTTLGALSTIANGAFLILTIPAWIVTGTVSHYGDMRDTERDLPGDFSRAEIDLRAMARFPQGVPVAMSASFRRLPAPR